MVVDGDAYLTYDDGLAIVVTDLRLPATAVPDTDLAKLDLVQFKLVLGSLRQGGPYLSDIIASGLQVNVIRREDGVTTWKAHADSGGDQTASNPVAQVDLISFLGERHVSFYDMRVRVENRRSGFEYDFELETFRIDQLLSDGTETALVRSEGRLNDETFSLSGTFPEQAPFEASGSMGDLMFRLDGEKPPQAERGDFDGRLAVETPDTQNLLDILKLKGTFDASAETTMTLTRREGLFKVDDIKLDAALKNGKSVAVTGQFEDLRLGLNFDLNFFVDFAGEDQQALSAVYFKDIRIQNAEIRAVAQDGEVEIDRFELKTNAFDEEVRDIGPFRIGRVQRQENGQLQLESVSLTVGPAERPYLQAEGHVDNLLTFKGYELSGQIDFPAQRVFRILPLDEAEQFGRLTGDIQLHEQDGEPELARFEANLIDSDIWSAFLKLSSDDIDNLDAAKLETAVHVPDGRKLLEALDLDPIDTGPLGYDFLVTRNENVVTTSGALFAGKSAISTQIALSLENTGPILRGDVRSADLRIADVQNAIGTFSELSALRFSAGDKNSPEVSEVEVQPLVLPETQASPTIDDVTEYQPLVLPEDGYDLAINDVMKPENFMRLIDAVIDIDIERISGQQGISQMHSTLQLKTGFMQLGPVDVAYGGGTAQVTGSMDVVDTPQLLRIVGQAGGWDIGALLQESGSDIGASGILSGKFDLTGRYVTPQAFAASMRGAATIELQNGRLDSALLDLAGLGVLPWLFSEDRRRGYAQIVCLKAPLQMTAGHIDTSQSVLETDRVQLVAQGSVDINGNSVSIRAEPRPVGQPLSRSAWPFEITGPLDAPEVRVAKRETRRALVPLSMPDARVPCVPDIAQLEQSNP